MTGVVAHSTSADGSFSATGKAAWDANHTLTGVGTMAEQNANAVAITGGSISGVSGVGSVTSVAALTLGTTGTDLSSTVATGTTTPVITLQVPTASAANRGALSAADWATFNNKQPAFGSQTANYVYAAPNGSAGTPTFRALVSADITLALDNLSDVTIATPTVDQILKYNGSDWVNGAANSISGGAGIEFFNATPIITASGTNNALQILTLSQTPVTTAEQTTSTASINGTVASSAWLSPALGRTTIDAGVWNYTVFASVSSIGGVNTTITRQMYAALPFVTGTVTTTGTGTSRTATASAGTPFALAAIDASATNTVASYLQTPQGLYQITARTSDTVVTISTLTTYVNETAVAGTVWKLLFAMPTSPVLTTTIAQYDNTSTQPAFTVTALTKLAGITFVISTGVRTVTTTYNGTTRNTHIASPLAVLHNQLGGIQGGTATENYHLTDAEYTGTGTGVFARAASPTFTGTLTCATLVATVGISGGAF